MSFLLPEKEIKETLAKADAVLEDVHRSILPRANQSLITVNSILDDLKAISAALREIFVRPKP